MGDTSMPNFSLDELLGSRYFNQAIGFDPFFKTIDSVLLNSTSAPSYPPHDIVNQKKGVHGITLALAGFDKEDLDVSVKEQTLTIAGDIQKTDFSDISNTYTHRGIAKRNFKKIFALGRNIEVENVVLKNGLLTVHLKENLPKNEQTQQIEIMQI